MGENNESFREQLGILAEVSELLDSCNILDGGQVEVVVTQPEEIFRKTLSKFRSIDINNDKFIIDISGLRFNFLLQK